MVENMDKRPPKRGRVFKIKLTALRYGSPTTLREKLIKIGAKVVRHGRYVTFQLAEVAVPKKLFRKILSLIDDLRRRPVPA